MPGINLGPVSWDPQTAGFAAAADVGHSSLRRAIEARNPANLVEGAEAARESLPQGGDVAKLQEHLNKLRNNGGSTQAIAEAERMLGEARRSQWAQRAKAPDVRRAIGEAYASERGGMRGFLDRTFGMGRGRAGPRVQQIMQQTRPDLAGIPRPMTAQQAAATAAEEGEIMQWLRNAERQGRANRGAYVGTLESVNFPHPKGSKVPSTGVKPGLMTNPLRRNMIGRGLLYGALPLAAGHLRRTNYIYDPANYTPEKLLGRK